MDNELNALAVLVLQNALFRKMKRVLSAHVAAAEGLEGFTTAAPNVYYFESDNLDHSDELVQIYTSRPSETVGSVTTGCTTLAEAFTHKQMQEIWVEGRKEFERRDGEWYYIGDQDGK